MDEEESPFPMPQPLTKNAYEKAVRYRNHNSMPACDGFVAEHTLQKYVNDLFCHGWIASEKGAKICFQTEGTELAIQYRKSVKKPAPVAVAVVDGDEKNAVVLDANFEETWGDCLTSKRWGITWRKVRIRWKSDYRKRMKTMPFPFIWFL